MVVELIPATSYALTFAVGQPIEVRDANTATSPCYFQGRVTDIQRRYDMPYNSISGYAPGDRITITASGALGAIGTGQLNNYSMASGYTWSSIANIASTQGVSWSYTTDSGMLQNSTQTLTGSSLDAINQLMRTSQMTVDEIACQRTVTPQPLAITTYPTGTALNTISFTDTGSGYAYQALEFVSSVQQTFNWVSVQAAGLAAQVASGTAPFNSLNYTTYSANTTDAANLASYVYNLLSGQVQAAPFSISTTTMASSNCMALAQLLLDGFANTNAVMGQQVGVTFRGSTSYGIVVGVNSAFYSDHAAVQLYLSPSLGTPFTLDSSAFGVLDTNRLGYP
jgi:hypothetical protein